MGTTYSVVAVDHSNGIKERDLRSRIDTALAEVNQQMSNWDVQSDVSRFNASRDLADIEVASPLVSVVEASKRVSEASNGNFDITVGPLVDLWGFGAAAPSQLRPTDESIADVLATVGEQQIDVTGAGTLRKRNPNTEIYLSAIGKGYGVDRVASELAALGVTDYMVEIGGDLVTAGRNPSGEPWQIAIESPVAFDRQVEQVVGVSDLGLATSGDYRNFFERDGIRYSHIIDPHTGYPVTHQTASATVLTEDAMMADAWATAMLTLGSEAGREIADQQGLAVLFIDRIDGSDDEFRLVSNKRFGELKA
ncbi:MAG: FAD:protein FMN transferase [Pseudomonadota bacterium]